jgi:hypothetical protein
LNASRARPQGGPGSEAKITLHIPHKRPVHKRKTRNIVEPLRGNDNPGDKEAIHHILAHSEPIRVKHGRRSTRVEEFLVRWEPETCTFGEEQEQYRLGFDIVSINNLEEHVPSHFLQPVVAAKRLDKAQRRALRRRPSLRYTLCNLSPLRKALSTSAS